MKTFIALCFIAYVAAAPLEDTEDVKMAKEQFMKAFDAAKKGEHAVLAPAPVATSYLADDESVAVAKEQFMKAFEAAEKGEYAILGAPAVAPAALPALTYGAWPYGTGYVPTYYNNYPYAYNSILPATNTYNTVLPTTAYNTILPAATYNSILPAATYNAFPYYYNPLVAPVQAAAEEMKEE